MGLVQLSPGQKVEPRRSESIQDPCSEPRRRRSPPWMRRRVEVSLTMPRQPSRAFRPAAPAGESARSEPLKPRAPPRPTPTGAAGRGPRAESTPPPGSFLRGLMIIESTPRPKTNAAPPPRATSIPGAVAPHGLHLSFELHSLSRSHQPRSRVRRTPRHGRETGWRMHSAVRRLVDLELCG